VLGGRSHGELFFHPWVLPPFVSPCPASCCLASRSTLHHRCCCKLNGSSRLEACCKLNGATSQRNTTRKVQIGSKHFQFTAKLASYWNHHQSFKTSRTTNLYAYARSSICTSFTQRLSRKAIKHMRKAFSHSVRRSSPNASRTGVFYWPLKINFWIYESAVYICCSFKCETYGCSHFIVVSLYDTSSSPHEDLLLSHMKTCCLITVFVYKINCSAYTVDGVLFIWWEGQLFGIVGMKWLWPSKLSLLVIWKEISCSSSQLDTRHNSDKSLFNLHYTKC